MAITLKEVADLIKTGDAVQIQNQEDQGKTLDSIDKGIKKFLAVQERDRLDKLEDRREQRKVRTIAGGGMAVAGGATAGGVSSGGPSTMSRILTQGVGTALALGALKAIQVGFRGIRNALAKSFGTQRGALLDINKSLTSELKDFQKVLKDDIKALKAQQKALNSELKKAYTTEADLRRQIQAETRTFTEAGQQRMKALQARLDDAIARRQVLQTDLDSARADLSSARLDLKETRVALSEARAAGKLDAQALRNQVAALERRIAGLRVGQIDTEQAFTDRALRLAGPNAQLGTLKVGDNIQYKTTTGKLLDAQVTDTTGGKVQLKVGSNVFAVDAQNLADRTKLPGYGEARIPMTVQEALRQRRSLLNPLARGTRFNNLTRVLGIGAPETLVEATAATGSRITGALGMTRTASTLGATSRFLGGIPGTVLGLITTPSSAIFGGMYTPDRKAIEKVLNAFQDNDIVKFKVARQELKQYVTTKYSQIKSLDQYANSYIFMDVLLAEMGIFRTNDVSKLTKQEIELVVGLRQILTLPIEDIATVMKESLGANFEKFKKFNSAVNAAMQDPNIQEKARAALRGTEAYTGIRPGSANYPQAYQNQLYAFARDSAVKQFGLKGKVLSGAKLSAIESAIATPTYGPRIDNLPPVIGQIGDNVQGGDTNFAIPGNYNTPFDPAAMLK